MTLEEFNSCIDNMNQAWSQFSKAIEGLKLGLSDAAPSTPSNIYNLEITLFSDLEPFSDTLSKGRVRIFYKGLNRNRTFISEDFANQLIQSLPYCPVKGIFNKEEVDYEDHGEDNTDGRIYGLVAAEPNFAWEDHMDSDGVIRTYACADVIYFTGLYPEAKIIPGSSQSMEIYRNTLKGEWKTWEDGEPYYHFYSGSLLGLQVLGTMVEPCFEGAAFYSLKDNLEELIKYTKTLSEKEESVDMEKTLFRLSDNDKAELIAMALNPNFNEEGNWEMSSIVLDVYDDYALIGNVKTGGYQRAYYTKDGDNVTIGDVVDVYIVDVTATESAALEAMKSVSGTYEAANAAYTAVTEENETLKTSLADMTAKYEEAQTTKTETENTDYTAQISSLETTIAEKDEAIAEATTSYSNLEAEKIRLENEKADLESERDNLLEFKKNVETAQKQEILAKYGEHLSDEAIENFKASIDTYSVEDFEKEVCVTAVKNSPSIFSKTKDQDSALIYKNVDSDKGLTGMERLLEKHRKGGNK